MGEAELSANQRPPRHITGSQIEIAQGHSYDIINLTKISSWQSEPQLLLGRSGSSPQWMAHLLLTVSPLFDVDVPLSVQPIASSRRTAFRTCSCSSAHRAVNRGNPPSDPNRCHKGVFGF